MTFAVIPWLSISINLLLVIFVIVCLLMILLILMQRPKQEGLGAAFGGGVTDQVFGARTTNVLQRGTVYLGSLFFILALTLAVLIGHQNKKTSMLKPAAPVVTAEEKPAAEPKEEVKPKSLSEELPVEVTPPTTPSAPTESETPPATPPPAVVTPAVVTPPTEAPAPPAAPEQKPDQP